MQFGYRECGSNKEDRAYNVLRVATVTLSIPILPHINFPGYVAFELHQQQQLSTQPTTTFNTQRLPQTLTDGSFNMFQSNSSSGLDMKKCSRCKKTTFPNMFYRRGATWKTCNACSAASSAAHAANRQETLRANTSPTVWPGNDAYITAVGALSIVPERTGGGDRFHYGLFRSSGDIAPLVAMQDQTQRSNKQSRRVR
jgi:hypothetical protein